MSQLHGDIWSQPGNYRLYSAHIWCVALNTGNWISFCFVAMGPPILTHGWLKIWSRKVKAKVKTDCHIWDPAFYRYMCVKLCIHQLFLMVDGALGDYNYLFPQFYYFIMVLKQTVNMLDDALQYSQKYQNVLFSTSHDNVLSHLQNL